MEFAVGTGYHRAALEYLELHARNREVVRILFVLDACDREIIAWSAVANAGVPSSAVRGTSSFSAPLHLHPLNERFRMLRLLLHLPRR